MYKLTTTTTVVGIDVHKYSHTAVALNCLGKELGTLEFSNNNLPDFQTWLERLDTRDNLIIGLEDINRHGLHLTRHLLKSQFQAIYVPPALTERQRVHSTHREKTDHIDAKRVGKAILNKIEEALPATDIISSKFAVTRSIDLLVQEYDNSCKDQTRLKNQLHALLHQYYGDNYRQEYRSPFTNKAVAWYQEDLQRDLQRNLHGDTQDDVREGNQSEEDTHSRENNLPEGDNHSDQLTDILAGSLLRRLTKLTIVQGQLRSTLKELELITNDNQQVQTLKDQIPGCGLLTACRIISEIGDINRFQTANQLARYMGLAPVHRSSGQRQRLHTDRYGNRKLNKAIHWIAIAQIGGSGYPPAKSYYQRKQQEGKTKLWSIRCLKRQIVKVVFKQLSTSQGTS